MSRLLDMDEQQKQMAKAQGVDPSQVYESPLQKSHRELVESPDKLGHYICILMNKMVQKGRDPTWDNFCGTPTWAVHGMNLSEKNREKFAQMWVKVYKELMAK